jgi:hypothetical protein
MSSPAVIFGRPLLPSLMGRSSFLGVRARIVLADPRVVRIWGVGLLIPSS